MGPKLAQHDQSNDEWVTLPGLGRAPEIVAELDAGRLTFCGGSGGAGPVFQGNVSTSTGQDVSNGGDSNKQFIITNALWYYLIDTARNWIGKKVYKRPIPIIPRV